MLFHPTPVHLRVSAFFFSRFLQALSYPYIFPRQGVVYANKAEIQAADSALLRLQALYCWV
jgi:hypothetical protein